MSSIKEPGRPVLDACSSSYSEWSAVKIWSPQEWESGGLMGVRTGRPVCEQPPGLFTQHTDRFIVDDDDMDSDTVAESDMWLKSRSFLHRVNDRVRKIQNQSSKDATQDSNKFFNMENVYFFDIRSICFHGKNTQKIYVLSKIHGTISQ